MRKIFYAILLSIAFYSCTDALDKVPETSTSEGEQFSTDAGYVAALNGVFSQAMKSYRKLTTSTGEEMSDNLLLNDGFGIPINFYTLNHDMEDKLILQRWIDLYTTIANNNNVISNARSGEIDNADNYLGQALGMRALLHYQLYQWFAPAYKNQSSDLGIPYRYETLGPQDLVHRGTVSETFTNIIADLLEAESLLSQNSGSAEDSETFNQTAAQALLARVYLEMEDMNNAALWAERALSTNNFLETTSAGLENKWWLNNSNEIIFRFLGDPGTAPSFNNNDIFGRHVTQNYYYVASDDLLNLYSETNDHRFDIYFTPLPADPSKYYISKHLGMRGTTADTDGFHDIIICDVAELYLIMAEANQDVAMLNTLRNARGLANYDAVADGPLTEAILNERRRELAFQGLRTMDLRRLNLGFTRADGISATPNDNRLTIPIPLTEITRSGIIQNPGYN